MKFNERLYVGNAEATPMSVMCNLGYRMPGNATIMTNVKPNMKQVIAYECGYDGKMMRYFMGYVESYKQINQGQYSLFCRELVGALRNPLPVSIQHTTLKELLAQVTIMTGLEFVSLDTDYMNTPVPHVINHGTGFALLDSLGDSFDIPKYLWQQMGDGRIFVGSWLDSMWYNRNIPIAYDLISQASINTVEVPCMPQLRPGVMVNGQRVRTIQQNKNKMLLTWMD